MWAVCTPAGQVPSQTASVESGRRGHAGQDSTAGGGLAAGLTSALTARGAEPPRYRAQSARPQLSRQLCSSLLSLTPDHSRPQLTQHGPRPPPRRAATSAHWHLQRPSRGLTAEQREHRGLCQGYTQP